MTAIKEAAQSGEEPSMQRAGRVRQGARVNKKKLLKALIAGAKADEEKLAAALAGFGNAKKQGGAHPTDEICSKAAKGGSDGN